MNKLHAKSFPIILMGILLLAGLTSCSKDEMPRTNPLDSSNEAGGLGLPSVADGSVENIYANGADFSGRVYDDGNGTITERGVCYNYSGNPSIAFYKESTDPGIGQYTCAIHNLLPGYRYYYRAYAKNAYGISYGNVCSFTTPVY